MPVVILKWIYIRIVSNILHYMVKTLRANRKWWVFLFSIAFVQVFLVMLFIFIFWFIKMNFWEWYFNLLITCSFLTELVHILKLQGHVWWGLLALSPFHCPYVQSNSIVHNSCHIGYSYNYLLDRIYNFPRSRSTAHTCVLNFLSIMLMGLFIVLGSFFLVWLNCDQAKLLV